MKFTTGLAAVATLLAVNGVSAVSEWGQCGGINYTGSKTCDSGLTCVYLNDYYYQCQKPSSTTTKTTTTTTKSTTTTTKTTTTSTKPTTTTTTTKSTTTTPTTTTTKTSTTTTTTSTTTSPASTQKFKFFGVNESGAEFGGNFFCGKGFNTFRVPFLVERLSPPANGLTGAFDSTYLNGLKTIVSYITGKGAYAIIDPHNYLRYNGAVVSDATTFATWWTNLANQFKSNPHVIFDLQNEPYGIDASLVYSYMQAAVNAIRSTGATNLIMVEGTSWTGAWSWTSSGNAAAFASLTDPANNIAIEMHQYLDSDGSGTSPDCVSSTVGVERLTDATNWLTSHGFKGFLGEIGAGSNDTCIAALKGAFSYMQQPGSPWLGVTWWAAGPWWGTYYQSMEPPNGPAVARILPEAFLPFV
ncbi:hypothetical protein FRB90_000039 [Tulasnella sp. 427]|nr:hypothetical protein FRB90_000039 [Tulasnella sp. 427]